MSRCSLKLNGDSQTAAKTIFPKIYLRFHFCEMLVTSHANVNSAMELKKKTKMMESFLDGESMKRVKM